MLILGSQIEPAYAWCYMGAIKFSVHDVVNAKGRIFIARKQDNTSLKFYSQKQCIHIGKHEQTHNR